MRNTVGAVNLKTLLSPSKINLNSVTNPIEYSSANCLFNDKTADLSLLLSSRSTMWNWLGTEANPGSSRLGGE